MSEVALQGQGDVRYMSILDIRQQVVIQDLNEDWTRITNPEVRRKLQNRLHQRIWRVDVHVVGRRQAGKRKASKKASTGTEVEAAQTESRQPQNGTPTREPLNAAFNQELSFCGSDSAELMDKLKAFQDYAHHEYRVGSPRSDLLLTLIRFNIFRALMDNNRSLGFDLSWLDEDVVSPFYKPDMHGQSLKLDCPHPLSPTRLQQTIEHHPWIDLFPFPQMRDNILRAGESFDDTPLCFDLVDNRQCLGEWSGLIVWGDPWDPRNWEASEDFLGKWSWVVQGCWELLQSSNWWRARRGEPLLVSDIFCPAKVLDASRPVLTNGT